MGDGGYFGSFCEGFFSLVLRYSPVKSFLLIKGRSGLWSLFVGVEGLPPFVFIRWPGGIISLGMLEGGSLGILAVFPYLGISRVVRSVVWAILFPGE